MRLVCCENWWHYTQLFDPDIVFIEIIQNFALMTRTEFVYICIQIRNRGYKKVSFGRFFFCCGFIFGVGW